MSGKFKIPDDEAELFRRAAGPVRRLEHDKVAPERRRPAPLPRHTREDERRVLQELLSGPLDPAELETGEELLFHRPGLQHRLLRKLRRGQISVRAELDLHGMTVPVAREALAAFLARCRAADIRCVRIIHGKGRRSRHKGPVLKAKVNQWLRRREEVLAFCSARPMDGGTGAIYVLLKGK